MLKMSGFMAIAAGLALAPLQAAPAEDARLPARPSHVGVIDAEGKEIGTVVVEQTPGGVLITLAVEGLPPGEHGFHIHEKGVCDPAEGFGTAGGHFDPGGHQHGLRAVGGPHAGDMPNQFVGSDGVLRVDVLHPVVTLGEGANSLADKDGSALIIHEGADDYKSQPTGAAGGRLACAVISPPADK
jgi:superoxide dismutase, Cu-Zn family